MVGGGAWAGGSGEVTTVYPSWFTEVNKYSIHIHVSIHVYTMLERWPSVMPNLCKSVSLTEKVDDNNNNF
jgi:hypothetical protein